MASSITLQILTPLGSAVPPAAGSSEPRDSVEVPGVEIPGLFGELGVLPDHVPFITPVVPGVIRYREGENSQRLAVGTGFLEVTEDGRVAVMIERATPAGKVDVAEVTARLKDVSAELAKKTDAIDALEHRKLANEQAWLEAQLRAAAT